MKPRIRHTFFVVLSVSLLGGGYYIWQGQKSAESALEQIKIAMPVVITKTGTISDISGNVLSGDQFSGLNKTNKDIVNDYEIKVDVENFVNINLGISFKYPTSLNQITYNQDEYNGMYIILHKQNPFLVLHNGENPPARGAFWGDIGKDINNIAFIENFCTGKTGCSLNENQYGTKYVKYKYEYGIMGSEEIGKAIKYLIFNKDNTYRAIVISNESSNISEADMELIINTLKTF